MDAGAEAALDLNHKDSAVKPQRPGLDAVILALGEADSGLDVLARDIPRALLPLGNRPLLFYTLLALERSGFDQALVVTSKKWAYGVSSYVDELYVLDPLVRSYRDSVDHRTEPTSSFSVVTYPVEDQVGTAEALRQASSRLEGDMLVLTDDLVTTDLQIYKIADVHRATDSSLTLSFLGLPSKAKSRDSKSKSKGDPTVSECVAFGVPVDGTSRDGLARVLAIQPDADAYDSFYVPGNHLRLFPDLRVRRDVKDSHLYILSHFAVDLLVKEKSLSSLSRDFVPFLVRKQHKLGFATQGEEGHENYRIRQHQIRATKEDPVVCTSFEVGDDFAMRIDSIADYTAANRMLVSGAVPYVDDLLQRHGFVPGQNTKIGGDCCIGKNVTVGDKSIIQKSTIGSNTKIGSSVKITNCIVMDHVSIADGCTISGGVIGTNVQIREKSSLKECIVASTVNIGSNEDLRNEILEPEAGVL
ncbi:hypothetical protein NDN08_000743 [Rhodosorus marinus]|uniref:Translation initiation factor eIF2B subunit gamma n=1 Tax=Rhodosorus marinus TaxID=101924 RepID=A0AAV8UNZ5_9RHOD|nr:hypothetical protein NDN08_000743 [Rhodosorus marinus]